MEVVNGVLEGAKHFLQSHGWKLIGLSVAWFMVKDDVLTWLWKRERAASMRAVNDPTRVALLESERLRVREEQQRRANVELAEARERAKREKAERVLREEAKTSKPSAGNPLDGSRGGGGGGSYRPVRRNVNPGRGGG